MRRRANERVRVAVRAALAWTLLFAPAVRGFAQEKADRPLFIGETLRYTMSVLGVVGGEMTLSAREVELSGGPAFKFEMSAVSNEMLSGIFLVRDFLASWVDPRTLRSLRFEEHTVEGKRVRDELIEFDYEEGIARREGKVIPIQGDVAFDSLSSVYYLRTQPLEVGKTIELQVVARRNTPLRVEVQAREKIKTPAGTFQTLRVEPKSKESGLISKGKKLVIWLTDDERRIPVQIKSKLSVGTLTGKLKAIETRGN